MKANIVIFWMLAVFCAVVAAAYTIWSVVEDDTIEWAGTTTLLLAGAFTGMVAFYLGLVIKHQGGALPEDVETANIDDADPEIGHFGPWSWWPIALSAALALIFLGIAAGFWIAAIGVVLLGITIVGWTYEYYRGYHAR